MDPDLLRAAVTRAARARETSPPLPLTPAQVAAIRGLRETR